MLVLLAWCILKFRASVNPTPSRTSHNTLIEVIWTVGPVIILLFLAVPSFQLLTAQYTPPEEAKLTIKATGNQWNWDYEYQIEEPLSFNSALLQDADRAAAGKEDRAVYPRLLAVDNELVVPVEHHGARAGDRRRRDPRLRHAGLRHQDRRGAGPHQRDLVQGREGRPLLRPVLRAVRQGPRLHADRHPRRERRPVQDLAGRRARPTSAAPTRR